MTAAETYAACIDAVRAQRARLHGAQAPDDPWAGPIAQRFRADPHRPLDANLTVLASHIRPEDVLLDVGGGAGRVALPLALRCREVTVVDASPGMGAEFATVAAAAGIANARFVHANWLEAESLQGDVTLTSNVTYFVREIVPFVKKLASAARRQVMITVWSVANPNQNAAPPSLRRRAGACAGVSRAGAGIVGTGHAPRCARATGCAPGARWEYGNRAAADTGERRAVGVAGAVAGATRSRTRTPSYRRTILRAICCKARGFSSPLASGGT